MKLWYCIRKCGDAYVAQYRFSRKSLELVECNDCWQTQGQADTWEGAYELLCDLATPAALAVRFVGTF